MILSQPRQNCLVRPGIFSNKASTFAFRGLVLKCVCSAYLFERSSIACSVYGTALSGFAVPFWFWFSSLSNSSLFPVLTVPGAVVVVPRLPGVL